MKPSGFASFCAIGVLIGACGGGTKTGAPAGQPVAAAVNREAIVHEPCDTSGRKVEKLDVNNDGRADVTRVINESGHEICRATDFNHDGKPDLYEYFDESGKLRRRELDYDGKGFANAIELYENGKLTTKQFDTTGQHRIDTWDFYDANGKCVRRERDTTNDGRVDQWWTFDGDKVTVARDADGDGLPDPNTMVVLGGDSSNSGASPVTADAGAPSGDAGVAPQGENEGRKRGARNR